MRLKLLMEHSVNSSICFLIVLVFPEAIKQSIRKSNGIKFVILITSSVTQDPVTPAHRQPEILLELRRRCQTTKIEMFSISINYIAQWLRNCAHLATPFTTVSLFQQYKLTTRCHKRPVVAPISATKKREGNKWSSQWRMNSEMFFFSIFVLDN